MTATITTDSTQQTPSAPVPGGAFLLQPPDPSAVFTPEEFGAEAALMGRTAADFLRKEVLPLTAQIEAFDPDLMHRLMQKSGEIGLLGAEVPEVYGGLGLDNRTGALLAEKINWQQSFALTHEAHTVIATLPLQFFGSDAQKAKYLPKLASGEWIGSFCLSEPNSGSDATSAQTRAVLSEDGTEYVLNGTKAWITNTAFATLFTVFAQIVEPDGTLKFTPFLVERDTPGLSFGKEEHKLGMHGTSTRRVILENVRVPVENRIGVPGQGHYAAFCALNLGRFKLEAGAVGGLKETLAVSAAYANQRKQFGRSLSSFGLVQQKLGELAARLFVLESGVYRLAGLLDGVFEGITANADDAPKRYHRAAEEYAIECGIVKVFGSELYSWGTDEAIQIHGGYGYTEEFPVARAWRDQRLLRIGEGANEIVRVNIVTTLLRRAQQGRLDLDAAMQAVHPQEIPADPDAAQTNGIAFDPKEAGLRLPERMKTAALILLGLAQERFGDALREEQETVAAIAELIIGAYLGESAWVRANKLAEKGGTAAERAADAATLYCHETLATCRQGVWNALCYLHNTKKITHQTRRYLTRIALGQSSFDVISLRRRLAQAVIEREAYLW